MGDFAFGLDSVDDVSLLNGLGLRSGGDRSGKRSPMVNGRSASGVSSLGNGINADLFPFLVKSAGFGLGESSKLRVGNGS